MFWTDGWKLGASLWANGLALQETALAAAGVIRHRSGVIDAALRNPAEADLGELNRMVAEKITAFGKAGQAIADDWLDLQADWLALGHDLLRLAGGGGAGPAGARRIGRRGTRLALKASRTGGKALKPVHAAATANQRRLDRKKPVRR